MKECKIEICEMNNNESDEKERARRKRILNEIYEKYYGEGEAYKKKIRRNNKKSNTKKT